MANPHLTSVDTKDGTGSARYRLLKLAGPAGDHLLVIKKQSNWTGANLIATPKSEYYSMGVTSGICSTYSTRPSGVYADGVTMASNLSGIRNRKTVDSWTAGHKPLFYYCARSFPPYRIKYDSAFDATKFAQTLELGASWVALRFNLYGLPLYQATSVRAYWRLWNPSCIHDVATDQSVGANHSCSAYTSLYNAAGNLHYRIDGTLCEPARCEATEHSTIDVAGNANQGNGDGASCNTIKYDVFDAHNGVASSTFNKHEFEHLRLYAVGSRDASPYYRDVEITGAALANLKKACEKGEFYVHFGFNTTDMISAPGGGECMVPFSGMMVYVSRIELRLEMNMSRFNYT